MQFHGTLEFFDLLAQRVGLGGGFGNGYALRQAGTFVADGAQPRIADQSIFLSRQVEYLATAF